SDDGINIAYLDTQFVGYLVISTFIAFTKW
ncbi:unnamed protein product, partial [marine sediment metagenome]